MANYSQQSLLVPIIIALGKAGRPLETAELYPVLTAMLSPWGDDLKPYAGRKDSTFSQTIRNFTAPERLTDFAKKFVSSVDGKLSLTAFGQQIFDAIFAPGKAPATKGAGPTIQAIYFGAPGVGKSHNLKSVYGNEDDTVRTTFHPETDYASFVGCYKPQTVTKGDESEIIYKFQGQAFTEAYIEAWRRYFEEPRRDFFLVIEEINRGNCAQIFGDIFQLLDRSDDGFSDYSIHPDKDLAQYLAEVFRSEAYGIADKLNGIKAGLGDGRCMILPPNLHILATMNTSDQSLFPIDSAFKRRWEWVYMPIETRPVGEDDTPVTRTIETKAFRYDWSEFLEAVNKRIFDITRSEDKQLGFWFVKPVAGSTTISANDFVSKVLFYLWNDVFKDFGDDSSSVFNFSADGNPDNHEKDRHSFMDFTPHFRVVDNGLVDAFLLNLGVTQTAIAPKAAPEGIVNELWADEDNN